MSSSTPLQNSAPPATTPQENRKHARKKGKAVVVVTRERDHRRMLLPNHLVDLSISGIGIFVEEPFDAGDAVKIQLRNDTRRFLKEVHGIVRWSKAIAGGKFQVGIGLNVWFTPLDMQLMTQSGFHGPEGEKIWV